MNKSFFVAIVLWIALGCVSSNSWAATNSKWWPNYIDNRECLGLGVCGREKLNTFGAHDQPSEIVYWDEEVYWILEKNGWVGANGKSHTLEFNLTTNPTTGFKVVGSDIQLSSADGTLTNYVLEGFADAEVIIKYWICDWNMNNYCAPREPVYIKQPFRDLVNKRITPKIGGSKRQALRKWELLIRPKSTVQLRIRDLGAATQVRSLVLPGVVGQIYLRDDLTGLPSFSISGQSGRLFLGKEVRLNHRECSINAINPTVKFGTIKINDSQMGKIGNEIVSGINLDCKSKYEKFDTPPWGGELVHGYGAIHTVESVKLSTSNIANISGGNRIGLKKDGQVSAGIYVEGSFWPNKECGVDALTVGENKGSQIIKNFPDLMSSLYDDFNVEYSKIYWKLCKTKDNVSAGSYVGDAKIEIKYK